MAKGQLQQSIYKSLHIGCANLYRIGLRDNMCINTSIAYVTLMINQQFFSLFPTETKRNDNNAYAVLFTLE